MSVPVDGDCRGHDGEYNSNHEEDGVEWDQFCLNECRFKLVGWWFDLVLVGGVRVKGNGKDDWELSSEEEKKNRTSLVLSTTHQGTHPPLQQGQL